MADAARTTGVTSTLDASMGATAPQIYDYPAGEAIESGQAVTLTNGELMLATGAAVNAAAQVFGFAGRTVRAGQRLTVFGPGARFGGFTDLTPGTRLYLSATDGELADAATTGGTTAIAMAVTDTDIVTGAWF